MGQALVLSKTGVLERWPTASASIQWLFGLVVLCVWLFLAAAFWEQASTPWSGNVAGPVIRPRFTSIDERATLPVRNTTFGTTPFITPDRARAINAAVPFSRAPVIPAQPFRFEARDENYARARDCLASALWYEAGDDPAGQRSVAQVVLNRVRHPVFPKTVCGVVYQGADRTTGCQFTFTCDGSMYRRQPSAAAWARARANAEKALEGAVDPSVGLSTHYHTDWVVPYWSKSLTKIARVGTHLFFRFPREWGKPDAFQTPSGFMEPQIAGLAMLSQAHGMVNDVPAYPSKFAAEVQQVMLSVPAANRMALMGNRVSAADSSRGQFALQLNMQAAWGSYARVARSLCGNSDRCIVMGWSPDMAPNGMAAFRARRHSALFVYHKSGNGAEQASWDCRRFPRPEAQCLPGTVPSDPDRPIVASAKEEITPAYRPMAVNSGSEKATGTPLWGIEASTDSVRAH